MRRNLGDGVCLDVANTGAEVQRAATVGGGASIAYTDSRSPARSNW